MGHDITLLDLQINKAKITGEFVEVCWIYDR